MLLNYILYFTKNNNNNKKINIASIDIIDIKIKIYMVNKIAITIPPHPFTSLQSKIILFEEKFISGDNILLIDK